MGLSTGTALGSYQIVAPLGAGGMGEVYRARDTRLGREVAIKILPEGFADDPDRIARFQREAQLLAALDHPHIASIYGLKEAAGTRSLVLEFVDGESLAAQLQQPLLLDEALAIARQIVDALEAAHEKGDRPSRPETRERHADRGRPRQGTRLRADGRELFYLDRLTNGKIIAVSVNGAGSAFAVGPPQELFDSGFATLGHNSPYQTFSVSADGKRFLIPKTKAVSATDALNAPIAVMLNWDSALKK